MKKVLSVILALALVLSMSVNAFSASIITGEGSINWAEVPEIEMLRVVYPTDAAWDFLIDPLGVGNFVDGGTYNPNTATVDTELIFGTDEAFSIISTSSGDALISLNVKGVVNGGTVVFAATESDLDTATAPTIFVQVVSNAAAVNNATDFTTAKFSGTVGRAVTEAGTDLEYILKGSPWDYKTTSETVGGKVFWTLTPQLTANENGDGTLIYPTGAISTKGDWAAFSPTLDKTDPANPVVVAPAATISIAVEYEGTLVQYGDDSGATFEDKEYADRDAIVAATNGFVTGAYGLLGEVRSTGALIAGNINNSAITADVYGAVSADVKAVAGSTVTYTVARANFASTAELATAAALTKPGYTVYLPEKPASITTFVSGASTFTGPYDFEYNPTTGIVHVVRVGGSSNPLIVITAAGGNVYTINLTVTD